MIKISIQKRFTLTVPGLSTDQMRQLAETAIATEGARWARGLNLKDGPAKPLVRWYERHKRHVTNSPIRDLRYTGQMASARQITFVGPNRARVEFVGGPALLKANANQDREPQIGLSPMDRQVVSRLAQQLLTENVRGMKRTA